MMEACKDCGACRMFGKHAHWLLRLVFAAVFLYHGLPKFQDLAGTGAMMGVATWVATLVALAEVGGALLVLAGGLWKDWMTRLGGLFVVPVMVGAIWMVHWGQWNFIATESHPLGGIEFQVTLLALALFFALRGNTVGGADCEGMCGGCGCSLKNCQC